MIDMRAGAMLWGLAFALVSAPAAAQAPGEEPVQEAAELFEVVNVSVANIDVWVTDRDGQPVSGLGKDDFVVLRDGEPVPVTNFYAVTGGRPASVEAASVPEEIPQRNLEDIQALESRVADEHRLWLVLFVDNFNIDPNERKRIFPALAAFLRENVRSGAQAMIVTYDRALEVVEPFTNSYLRLEAAMDAVSKESGLATIRRRERIDTLQLIDRAVDQGQALGHAQAYAEDLMNSARYTADALERFLATLGGLPGRKALIHVSSGIPMTAGEEAFYAVAERFESSAPYSMIPRYDTTRRFEEVVRTANANRVVFYTTDAAGLRGLEFGAAEYAGFVNMDLRSTLDSIVPENLQAPLRMIALETGGRAILNQNEILRPLRAAARDFESFYSLGIASADFEDGTYHDVEVKLAEPSRGVEVRHRTGYLAKSNDRRARETLEAALLYEQPVNPSGFKVRWGRPEAHEKGTWLLPLQLEVPVAGITLLPTSPGRHETRLRLYFGAVSADGDGSAIDMVPFGVRLADEHVEAARGESLLHTHRMLMNRGRRKVGVGVFDVFTNEISIVTKSVAIGVAEDG